MTYKVVTLPSQFQGDIKNAVDSYATTINSLAAEGYKLITITSISSTKKEGCLKTQPVLYTADLLIFGKE